MSGTYHELSKANGLVCGTNIEVVFKLRLCRLDFFVPFFIKEKRNA
ncbi:MAG: hypothetical protein QM710_05010 [Flavobacterium sp.]